MIQPVDITFNRKYKPIVRTMYDPVRLYGIDCNLSERNNMINYVSENSYRCIDIVDLKVPIVTTIQRHITMLKNCVFKFTIQVVTKNQYNVSIISSYDIICIRIEKFCLQTRFFEFFFCMFSRLKTIKF